MNTRSMLPLLALVAVSFTLKAQTLPKVQEVSVYAPTDIKVDGKPAEWGKFQAYNKATQVLYTMANDDENLYLAMQAKYPDVVNRIFGGGFILSIQQTADKNDKNKISVTYPMLESNTSGINFSLGAQFIKGYAIDTSVKARDSIMTMHNKLISQKLKWIGVSGIKGVDSLISIYNGNGIKVTGLFDNREIYTLEIAVPLKYLNLSSDNGSKFMYHLQVNGIKGVNGGFGNVAAASPEEAQRILQIPAVAQAIAQRSAPTDFWGEYTLAKK